MRLIPCHPPAGPLDAAPATALAGDAGLGSQWDGFWSHSSDAYYARCTSATGGVEWFQVADESPSVATTNEPNAAVVRGRIPRIAPERRPAVIVTASPGGRPMLVGSTRRVPRS